MLRSLALAVAVILFVGPPVAALPTPGFNGEEARTVTGRIFP